MHVGITHTLLNDVSDRINYELKVKDYRLQFGVDSIANTFQLPSDHPVVVKILWGEHAHLQPQMPSSWLDKLPFDYNDKAHLSLQSKVGDLTLSISVQLNGRREITVPPKGGSNRHYVALDICPEIQEFFNKSFEEIEFNRKWFGIRQDVTKFLEANKSLNAALKAWPELRAFIPEQYLKRVEQKPERKSQQEKVASTLAEIDKDSAVAAAAIAALAI